MGGERIPVVLDRQVRIAVRGSGPLAERKLVAESAAARKLLAGPDGARAERLIRRVLALADGRAGAANVSGISFADSDAGFAANTLMSSIAWGEPALAPAFDAAVRVARKRPAFGRAVREWERTVGGASATYDGWINLGATPSKVLSNLIRDPAWQPGPFDGAINAIQSIAHEIEHAISAPSAAAYYTPDGRTSAIGKLEEAVAQLMTERGGAQRIARALGLRYDPASATPTYTSNTTALGYLLEAAGVDHKRTSFARLDAAIQSVPAEQLPARLADRIARRHGLDARQAARVERRIATVGDSVDRAYRLLIDVQDWSRKPRTAA